MDILPHICELAWTIASSIDFSVCIFFHANNNKNATAIDLFLKKLLNNIF